MRKWIWSSFFCFMLCFSKTYSATTSISTSLPGSAQPGLVQKNYLPESLTPQTEAMPSVQSTKEQKVTPLGPEAEKIKFKLIKIILEGNHTYSTEELSTIYKKSLNKEISVLDLQNLVQDITNFYRNNGYILTQAILPPQNITNGIVYVKIIEGYIAKVNVIGNPKGAKSLIQAYGDQIAAARPAQVKVMEKYLFLANSIPGTQVKAVLEPSTTEPGASDLNLVVEQQTLNAFVSYDNYGTRYIGPHQITSRIAANSIFLPGDSTSFTYLTATHGQELHYGDLNYMTNVGHQGLLLTLDGNRSITFPGFLLRELLTRGFATTYTISLDYPLIRERDQNLTISGNFSYMTSKSTQFSELLYIDRIRPGQIGVTYNFIDKYQGSNVFSLNLTRGFNVMGASDNSHSLFISRFLADAIFTKWSGQVSRDQFLFDRFSVFLLGQGQYSYQPLLVEQQFGFGGSQLGRGYDPAEILGDRGAAGSIELRMDNNPDFFKLENIQMYAFYDAGVIWNIIDLPGNFPKQSATSTGLGARFNMTKFINGNVMVTQPLTKKVATEELVGRGKCPRVFFSISATI